jgi:hypothetical protein
MRISSGIAVSSLLILANTGNPTSVAAQAQEPREIQAAANGVTRIASPRQRKHKDACGWLTYCWANVSDTEQIVAPYVTIMANCPRAIARCNLGRPIATHWETSPVYEPCDITLDFCSQAF